MQNESEKELREAREATPERKEEREEEQISPEQRETREERETKVEREEDVRERLEREAEKMQPSLEVAEDIKKHAEAVRASDDQGKVQRLLQLAQAKGVFFAIKVAKEVGDSYVLDLLHDALAKDSLYKHYLKDKS